MFPPALQFRWIAVVLVLLTPAVASAQQAPVPAPATELLVPYPSAPVPAMRAAVAPVQVVTIVPATAQALVWDQVVRQYRLLQVGQVVAGWQLVALRADGAVFLQGNTYDEIPLSSPPTPMRVSASPWQPVPRRSLDASDLE